MNLGNANDFTMKSTVSMLFFEESCRKIGVGSSTNTTMVRRRSIERVVNSKNNSRSKSKEHKNVRC